MKIVHASNFSHRRKSSFYYGVPYKLTNGFTRLGHAVLNFSDRDIADSYFCGIRALGRHYANESLVRVCEQMRPELLLIGHCTIISAETLLRIRQIVPGIRIAHWNCDALFLPQNLNRVRDLAPVVDATFVTTAGPHLRDLVRNGGRAAFMPNPVDSSLETLRVFDHDEFDNDLVFATGRRQHTTEKEQLCRFVRERLPGLRFRVHGLFGGDEVYGAEYFDLLGRSRMAINISARNDIHLYSSDRIAQLVGCGLLTFVDRRTGYDSIFSEDELVFFNDRDDLIAKLSHYMRDDEARREIARRGWAKAHATLNETVVAQWLIEATLGQKPSRDYVWPTTIYGSSVHDHAAALRGLFPAGTFYPEGLAAPAYQTSGN